LAVVSVAALPTVALAGRSPSANSGGVTNAADLVWLRYELDRTAVPAWVRHRALTLRINVGASARVWAWGDGQPLALQHDRQAGTVLVTTEADQVTLALQGPGAAPFGDVSATVLRDDKQWAYSLTFDDGHLTVFEQALPELEHYGYRAAVAVIGRWMAPGEEPLRFGYASPVEMRQLMNAGWGIFNHSYSHSNAASDINYDEAWRAQEAIQAALGVRPIVFTVPHTSELWAPVINNNTETLGLRAMQLVAADGARLTMVDAPITLSETSSFHIGRKDIKKWVENGYNYFDQAHSAAPGHAWVTLHGHNVAYDQDWCAVADSLAYLYHTYGAAATDQVWVAPADEVFEYLVVRSYTHVALVAGAPAPAGHVLGAPWLAPQAAVYRQGAGGYTGWQDTYLNEYEPTRNYGAEGILQVRAGSSGRASALLRVDITPPAADVTVEHATLSLYASWASNSAGMDMRAYALQRDWSANEATWAMARQVEPWAQPGARGALSDRAVFALDKTHAGGCVTDARWYTFDVTEAVADWLAQPEHNYGILIEGEEGVSKGLQFASSDHSNVALRPRLTVRYRWPASGELVLPSPTPTSTASPMPSPTRLHYRLPLVVK
jgi:peptidoglycan/xylan/chitin deacetylase (PgdA/CDA1 family)